MDRISRLLQAAERWGVLAVNRRSDGQGMSEYALILSGVVVVTIIAVERLDSSIGALLNRVTASLS